MFSHYSHLLLQDTGLGWGGWGGENLVGGDREPMAQLVKIHYAEPWAP